MARAGDKRSRDATEALNDVAASFRCSITSALVHDPVNTCDGQMYERSAIERWFATNSTSPNTGEALHSKRLVPSQAIKSAVERLVFSGCLAPEESREWLLRKAVALLSDGKDEEAQPLLERALVEGEAAAGWHLGRLLIQRAADAGVPAAAAAVVKLDEPEAPPNGRTTFKCAYQSVKDITVGNELLLLPVVEVEAAFAAHKVRQIEYGWDDLDFDERKRSMCGKRRRITKIDSSDQTVQIANDRLSSWWPAAAFCHH